MSGTEEDRKDLVQEQPAVSDLEGAETPDEAVAPEPVSEPGLLELIYGVLFDPVSTFRRVAPNPPLFLTFLIATLVNVGTTLMGVITYRTAGFGGISELDVFVAAIIPVFALISFFLWYLKWLVYGAVLHLVSQLFGGVNGPKATLSVYGLAGLPALLLLPVQGLIVVAGLGESVATSLMGLAGLVVFGWSLVLLVLGLREVHRFGTGQAISVVVTPVITIVLFVVLVSILAALGFTAFIPQIPTLPGLF
ncbi:MAG: YIP1 family protein [Desulforudis sp.]|jgi:hypothetical protein|nr:MAG: YIP1 family protein [Desulforudis sp.]